jgi:NEDD8-activating enzyme E1 regulatory subunit
VSALLENPSTLAPYTLILVVSPIKAEYLTHIATHCRDTRTPLFYVRSVGFYASFSIQLPHAFPIADTHPDPESTTDLRLLKPWPSLIEYASKKTRDIEKMNDHEHGHVPYLLLILHYLDAWKQSHDGRFPSNYKEKSEFRTFLQAGMRKETPAGAEENFEEAVAAVLKNLSEPVPRSAVKEVFNATECRNLTIKVRLSGNTAIFAYEIRPPIFG